MSDMSGRCAEVLHDLAENAEQSLVHARDLAAWLREHGHDNILLMDLECFLSRPDLPLALELEPAVADLDRRLRHAARSPRGCHRLVSRLAAMKQLARDLRGLPEPPPFVEAVLTGRNGLLELEKAGLVPKTPHEPMVALAVPNADVVRLVMVVEDDPAWRSRLEAKARSVFPSAACESYATCAAANARFDVLESQRPFLVDRRGAVSRQAILVLLDLGLPDTDEDGDDDTSRGMALLQRARGYDNLWRVVVITRPRNYLEDQRAATSMGVQPEDYIFKIDDAWDREIEESLRRLGSSGLSRIDVIYDEEQGRGTIRAGGVEFHLDGRPLLILKALAEAQNQVASESWILDEILERESTGFSDSLLVLRQSFVDAWSEVGRHLSPADVIRTEDTPPGDRPLYRLVPTAHVVSAGAFEAPVPHCATRALVVDDDPLDAERAARWLRRLGLEVRTASCGADAVQQAAYFLPQIVGLDLALPWKAGGAVDRQGGVRVLDTMRTLPGLEEIRAVVVSAYADDDGIRRAGLLRGVRVDDWLHKGSEHLASWVVRSGARLMAEIERGVVLSAGARSPWVLEIARARPWAALDGRDLRLSRSTHGYKFLRCLAERPWVPVTHMQLEESLGLSSEGSGSEGTLRQRAKRLRKAAGEGAYAGDTFIRGVAGGYVLRATVIWVD